MQRAVPLAILFAAIGVRWYDPPVLNDLRHLTFDQFQRLEPRPYTDAPVRIVDIDDTTLAKYGQWPWPRSRTAELVTKLGKAGAAAVAFDVVFAEPDRTSPSEISKSWGLSPDDPALAGIKDKVADPDEILAQAISKVPVVLGFVLTNGATEQKLRKKGSFAAIGRNPLTLVRQFAGGVASLDILQQKAAGNGSINVVPDRDGIVRRVPLILGVKGTLMPSLAAEALRVAQGAKTYVVKSSGAQGQQSIFDALRASVGELRIGNFPVETDQAGQIWLHDTGHVKARYVPAWKVLDGEPFDVKGRIVFIGTSAPGLGDLRSTPNQPVIAGVEIHAQAIEQIVTQDFLVRSPWANEIEVFALFVIGLLMIWLLPRVGPLGCAALGGLAIGLAGLAALFSYRDYGLLFDPVYPGAASFGVYVAGLLLSYQRSDVERKRVRDAFGHYLAPELVERLAADASQLKLGGEIREISLLFCDVRDFTSIAESMDAEQVTALLNRFLTPMTEAVLGHEGTIDKYIGDSIMAFWNAPLDDPMHAKHAFDAALEMRRRLADLNAELMAQWGNDAGFQPIRIGIGLNTGPCCVGNLGSAQRFNYSAMGDDVNLASRIEGVTKIYGLDILIAESTRALAPEYATVEIGDVRVKGKASAVRLHALIGGPDLAQKPNYQALGQAIGRVAGAIRSADAFEAERALQVARALSPNLGIEALLNHMAATIEGMLRQRGGQPTTMAAALP